jgi:hypothetical protein
MRARSAPIKRVIAAAVAKARAHTTIDLVLEEHGDLQVAIPIRSTAAA